MNGEYVRAVDDVHGRPAYRKGVGVDERWICCDEVTYIEIVLWTWLTLVFAGRRLASGSDPCGERRWRWTVGAC